jgi:hypothetical protein
LNVGTGGTNTSGVTYGKGGNGGKGGKYDQTSPATVGVPTAGVRGNDGVGIITWHFKYDVPLTVVYFERRKAGVITPPGTPVRFDYTLYSGAAGGGGGGGCIGTYGQSGFYRGTRGGQGENGRSVSGSQSWTVGGILYFGQGVGGAGGAVGTTGSSPTAGFPGSGGNDSSLNYNSIEIARAQGASIGGVGGAAAISGQDPPPVGYSSSPSGYSVGGAGGSGDFGGVGDGSGRPGDDGALVITWYYS